VREMKCSDALALVILVVVFISWSYITVNNQMFLNR
jgi:hypothetical protein